MRNNLIILATSVLLFGMVLGVMGPGVAYAAPAAANHGVVINEIRIDQPSSDNDEYFELIGPVGASLDDMTYIVIGDGPGGSGVVEAVVDLDGNAIPARGYFVAAESSFTLGTADLITDLNFENSDNVTHLLVKDFEGEKNDDLDTNDDGLLDVTPWSEIVDLIALIEEQNPPSGTEFHYGPPSLGPDYKYVPGHAYRCPSWWEIGEYDPVGVTDTPGEANECPDLLTIMEIQGDGQWSPYQWDFVTTSGVVTMISGDHFWFQDPEGDSDNSTSDGIYVYRGKRYLDLIVGDKIYITARVKEYVSSSRPTDLPLTELEFVTSIMIESYGHTLPEPVELEDVPNVSIPEGIDFYESLEGMLVYLRNAPVVSGTSYYGEFAVLAKDDAKP
ncbi:MAG: hypothetical protein GTO18_19605, partial [Anaerolineales bacterium]|nr:hypothetical protein [Anaerolineales bacterium]